MLIQDIEEHLAFLMEQGPRAGAEELTRHAVALDTLLREQGDAMPPRLRHYLGGRSYAKALELIRSGRDARGCGGHG